MERPADRRRLDDADAYLRAQAPRLVVLDEVHRVPELFEVLRGVIDENRRSGAPNGQFLLLGSASLDLVRFSSESLAGRVAHLDLGCVAIDEAADGGFDADTLWVRGGYPLSLTAASDADSAKWRAERDLGVESAYLVHPDNGPAYDSGGVTVIGLGDLVGRLRSS